ncbi:MAG: hypothetical protein U0N87_04870 [Anaerobutyricum sp.]
MPAKKEERGAEIDSCSLKISEEKIKILLYAWEKVYTYGDAESMCTDGIILNRYRQEILHVKSHLENLGSELSYAVPEKMPEEYMAQAETIRTQAQKAAEDYFASDDYRYLMTKFSYLNKKQRSETGVTEVYGKVQSLLNAVDEDNLVVMRELGTPGILWEQIQESAKRVRSIPFKITKTPEKEVIKKEDDYQIQGQLSIYDIEAS